MMPSCPKTTRAQICDPREECTALVDDRHVVVNVVGLLLSLQPPPHRLSSRRFRKIDEKNDTSLRCTLLWLITHYGQRVADYGQWRWWLGRMKVRIDVLAYSVSR
mmetsp:Transcript_37315/g.68560  ORF Transcript_37315/g.68560 Transcript_37315/m.68560 type:complete len:105 (+) Transcript_37315:266-580(+)